MNNTRIALFRSNYETMKGEKYFKKYNISFKLIIAPRDIVSGCGMGLEFYDSNTEKITTLCKKEGLHLNGIYKKSNNDWKKI